MIGNGIVIRLKYQILPICVLPCQLQSCPDPTFMEEHWKMLGPHMKSATLLQRIKRVDFFYSFYKALTFIHSLCLVETAGFQHHYWRKLWSCVSRRGTLDFSMGMQFWIEVAGTWTECMPSCCVRVLRALCARVLGHPTPI